jgi:hypothetical protein
VSGWLVAVIAVVTYASRAVALVVLPRPTGGFARVLARMPAPIFASLATLTLVTGDRALVAVPVLAAALGALLVTPWRSLPLCLLGGLAGYGLGRVLG